MNELVNCSANARRSCFGAITLRDRSGYSSVSSTIEGSPVHLFSNSTPLFEKEPYAILFAFLADGQNPFFFHGSRSGATLTANDYLVNSIQADATQVLKQWFDRKKLYSRWRSLQMPDSR
jgi:hypothetical protein